MRKLKIGLVARRVIEQEGQGRISCAVIRRAVERGHEVILFSEAVSPEIEALPSVTWEQLSATRLPTVILQDLSFALKSRARVRAYAGHLDLLQVEGCVCFIRSDVTAVHYVHTAWLKNPNLWKHAVSGLRGVYQLVLTGLGSLFERLALRRSAHLIAVSESVKAELVSLRRPVDAIHVITNGVMKVESLTEKIDLSDLQIPKEAFVLLFAGDLQTNRKNLGTLLRAVADVPQVHLLVAGGIKSHRFPRLALALGISQRVHFLGFRSADLMSLMASVDLFVLASYYEPFGLVLLEAMAVGTPVLTSANVGAAPLVGGAGVVLEKPEDVAGMAGAIRRLAEDRDHARQLGASGPEITREHGTGTMANRYVDLYEKIGQAGTDLA